MSEEQRLERYEPRLSCREIRDLQSFSVIRGFIRDSQVTKNDALRGLLSWGRVGGSASQSFSVIRGSAYPFGLINS